MKIRVVDGWNEVGFGLDKVGIMINFGKNFALWSI